MERIEHVLGLAAARPDAPAAAGRAAMPEGTHVLAHDVAAVQDRVQPRVWSPRAGGARRGVAAVGGRVLRRSGGAERHAVDSRPSGPPSVATAVSCRRTGETRPAARPAP